MGQGLRAPGEAQSSRVKVFSLLSETLAITEGIAIVQLTVGDRNPVVPPPRLNVSAVDDLGMEGGKKRALPVTLQRHRRRADSRSPIVAPCKSG